jgi:hypothetical protein
VDDYTGIGDVWFPPELVLLDDPPVPWLGYRGNWGRPKVLETKQNFAVKKKNH